MNIADTWVILRLENSFFSKTMNVVNMPCFEHLKQLQKYKFFLSKS